jgi:gamma-glutamyl hercynylcysteine S-oxide synthase
MAPQALLAWYRKNRARTRELFDLLSKDAYYSRPIALRHPIVFYEGHLPAFSFNTLIKNALGRPSIDVNLERLFARGHRSARVHGHGGLRGTADARRVAVT